MVAKKACNKNDGFKADCLKDKNCQYTAAKKCEKKGFLGQTLNILTTNPFAAKKP